MSGSGQVLRVAAFVSLVRCVGKGAQRGAMAESGQPAAALERRPQREEQDPGDVQDTENHGVT